MQLNELKILFDSGTLKSCLIVRYMLSNEWCVQVEKKSGSPVMMNAQRVSPRRFKSLDAAYKAASELGFRKVMVHE